MINFFQSVLIFLRIVLYERCQINKTVNFNTANFLALFS